MVTPLQAEKLKSIYYDPEHPAAYGGVARLSKAASIPVTVVTAWLRSQPTYTLHKPARRHGYKTRKYLTSGIDHQWQSDLVDMQVEAKHNDGFKYIMTVIDLFSRQAWAEPLKTKSPQHVKVAFEKIFAESGRKPFKMQTDQGLEYESATMKRFWEEQGIKQFSVKSQFKAAVVERFNRTLKDRMWRYFTQWNTRKWLEILPKLVAGYNKAYHRGIETTPNAINKENEMAIWLKREPLAAVRHIAKRGTTPRIGDSVRLSKVKGAFAKGYLPNWTEEVFSIRNIITKPQSPTQYQVSDYDGNEIEGSYYLPEIQVVDKPATFRIERVIETKKVNGKNRYLVKWLGYPAQFNEWIGQEQFVKLDQK